MTSCYLDTSFLIKLYVFEEHSAQAAERFNRVRDRRVINRLSDLEVVSTLRRKSLDGWITASETQVAVGKVRAHRTAGIYDSKAVSETIFSIAERLVDQHGEFIRLRSLDLLHVATALHYGVDGFATYDDQLKVLAERVGLTLLV